MILWRSILSIGKCDTATSPRQTRAKWHSIQKLPGIYEVSPWLRIPLGDSLQPFHFWFFVTVEKRFPSLSVPAKLCILNLSEFNRKIFMKITRKIMEHPCFVVFFDVGAIDFSIKFWCLVRCDQQNNSVIRIVARGCKLLHGNPLPVAN